MARDIKTTQADPTAPRPVDPDGRPRDDPAAWAPVPAPATPPQD